jgi:YggT family protein
MDLILPVIRVVFTGLTWLVIINAILSYIISPFHPLKMALDRIVGPMLAPIRRIMPQTGMIDFSPLILIILLQLVEFILTQVLSNF